MFKSFITVAVAYGIGYVKGYIKGQDHTSAIEKLTKDVRDSPETLEFFKSLADAIKEAKFEIGPDFDGNRWAEIINATPENPVTLTKAEIRAMKLSYVKAGLDSGRFTEEVGKVVDQDDEVVYKRTHKDSIGELETDTPPTAAEIAKSEPDPDNPDRPII